jgi:hypothetical protein
MDNLASQIYTYLMINKTRHSHNLDKYVSKDFYECLSRKCNRLIDDDEALYCLDRKKPEGCEYR